jgi:hypothetical protein
MRFHLRTLLIALLVFNTVSVCAYLLAEAVSVTSASNEHGHLKDPDDRFQKMSQEMDKGWHRLNFNTLAFAWTTINFSTGAIALAAFLCARK